LPPFGLTVPFKVVLVRPTLAALRVATVGALITLTRNVEPERLITAMLSP
jgi:hypothetical protein